ncbi:hypothetical protein SELMODRAFT_177477 [Selaginella moellendorffii]|uniref:ApaG domain-containing protein n=1 Tax=Selaginella moellendorffii TaxID=88036 RepID=D8S712_SELML|nr:F-box protein SKIP16 [Selaginella moellendorffii]EFJ19533.1 hypothetical protein SELMODRAFT_177477 [Selaginella moellendorffii]|eukprot:XP_002979125.1 F-box protein SKIP16 [Selaginella moellendorffii]
MEDVLPALLLQTILARTDAVDCARVACVNRRWRALAHDDTLWSQHCRDEYGVCAAADFMGNPCCSFKETYAAWHDEFNQYGGLVYRTKKLWDDLKGVLRSNYPAVADSLARQASEADIVAAESTLGWPLPPHVRLLYRFCDGQQIVDGDEIAHQYVGLLGGYYFYNHFVNVQLLPLQQVVSYTQRLLSRAPAGTKRIVIAASCNLNKFFLLDCDSGMVLVGTKNFLKKYEVMPCLPLASSNPGDGMLRWLEEYRDGLLSGKYTVRNDDGIRSISLYPENGSTCTEAVTQGIQVRASAVFVPELSDPEALEKYLFSYSVRMRFLPVSALASNQCQLSRRHWVVTADDEIVDEVRAEAVVGMYPLLKLGGDAFVYESCSTQNTLSGSLEGDFTFVPGCLSRQEGPEFCVRVAPFPMQVPRYIF